MRKALTIFAIAFIFIGTVPLQYTFADTIPEGYSPAGYNDQVDAFRAYCKSRNVTIEGSVLDAITSVTSSMYSKICNTLGIDINELQNQIYKGVGSNAGKWYFTNSGIGAMNRIFSEFLQNNNLEVGDVANQQDNTVYDGKEVTDSNGNKALIWITTQSSGSLGGSYSDEWGSSSQILQEGSYYLYSNSYLVNHAPDTLVFPLAPNTILNKYTNTYTNGIYYKSEPLSDALKKMPLSLNGTYNNISVIGFPAITQQTGKSTLYLNFIYHNLTDNTYKTLWSKAISLTSDDVVVNANVYIDSHDQVINNNIYEGDTIINDDGTTDDNDDDGDGNDDDDPISTPPDWGDPTTPQDDVWNTDDDGVLHFPKIEFPDLDINWSLKNILKKFPFCIPGDIVAFFRILDAEPQAPHIQGSVPFGNWYIWQIDVDLSQYDTYAIIVRNVEFFGFIIGLIYFTVRLVRG